MDNSTTTSFKPIKAAGFVRTVSANATLQNNEQDLQTRQACQSQQEARNNVSDASASAKLSVANSLLIGLAVALFTAAVATFTNRKKH